MLKRQKQILTKQFSEAKKNNVARLSIITGFGKHSENRFGVLFRRIVPDFLEKSDIKSNISQVNKDMGSYVVEFKRDIPFLDEFNKMKKLLAPILYPSEKLESIKKKAEEGSSEDQFNLSTRYNEGYGVPLSKQLSLFWLEKAANNGLQFAQMLMGCIYDIGTEVKQSYKKAMKWHKMAAVNDNQPYSIFTIGTYYWLGLGTLRDDLKAIEYLKKAAELKEHYAAYNLGVILIKGDGKIQADPKTANAYLIQAAEGEMIEAQVLLAKQYFFGLGIDPDFKKALYWFSKAADAGDMISQYYVGRIYSEGLGCEVNVKLAIESFEKSAKQGDEDAKKTIACALVKGIHYKRNVDKGIAQLKELAEQGHPESAGALGLYFLSGIKGALKSDLKQAIEYLTKSANLNDVDSQKILADLYLVEDLVEGLVGQVTDPVKGEYWLKKAADQDDSEAQFDYGHLLRTRESKEDQKRGIGYLASSAKQKNPKAMMALSFCYQSGTGVTEDEEKALYWLKQAADFGNDFALHNWGYHLIEQGQAKEAFSYFLKAAELGLQGSKRYVARAYLNSIGVECNIPKAIEWFKNIAEDGDGESEFILGEIYSDSSTKFVDLQQSVTWLTKSLSHGHRDAGRLLRHLYVTKSKVDTLALKVLESAAEAGNLIGLDCMVSLAFEKPQLISETWMKKAIEQDDIVILCCVANLYNLLGKKDKCISFLQKIVKSQSTDPKEIQMIIECEGMLKSLV